MKGDQTTLSIKHIPSGQNILRLPLTQYLLLSKIYNDIGEMSDQEYLDRQDEYNMTFFLDENNHWLSTTIIINSWRVVLNSGELSDN